MERLAPLLEPGDVLLVDGSSRFSTAIKYLTQSSWSHAALYVGAILPVVEGEKPRVVIEADVNEGVRAVALEQFEGFHTRICRPIGLSAEDREHLVRYMVLRVGYHYDLKNVMDLARYLLPTPPVPSRWRRRMIALGSGEPTRAICSTLIAQAFQSIGYPILPNVIAESSDDPRCLGCRREILHIRHHSLFAPRDFDVSPYFQIIKPTLEMGFDYRSLQWAAPSEEESAQASTRRRLLVLDPKPLPGAVQRAPGEGTPEQPRP
jgi:hypothetical protein